MHNIKSKESRNQEEDRSQEEERKVGFEFVATATGSNAMPVPDRAAVGSDVVCKQTKSDHETSE